VALAERGFRMALLGRPSPQHAEGAALVAAAGNHTPFEVFADFQDAPALERAAAQVVAELGAPSVVVHNAGLVVRARIEDTSVSAWDVQLDVNLRAPFVPPVPGASCSLVASVARWARRARPLTPPPNGA
jgi:NAD(P)-dependent dehydrogenase (short-subunit alcohol dehydrogenase family)